MAPRMALILLATLVALAPVAAAQDDTDVNESDYDTSVPPSDESYLNDSHESGEENASPTSTGSGSEPADGSDEDLQDDDFDTSVPEEDESYLNDDASTTSADGEDVSESDFDTSLPTMDDSWLNDEIPGDAPQEKTSSPPASGSAKSEMPGFGLLAGLVAIGAAAAVAFRR